MLFSDWSNRESSLESSSKRKRIKYCMYLYICNQEVWVVWVVPEKIHTPPQRKFLPSEGGRGGGVGMDVFWNDPMTCLIMIIIYYIFIPALDSSLLPYERLLF
jgi:hypothetical protein